MNETMHLYVLMRSFRYADWRNYYMSNSTAPNGLFPCSTCPSPIPFYLSAKDDPLLPLLHPQLLQLDPGQHAGQHQHAGYNDTPHPDPANVFVVRRLDRSAHGRQPDR